MTAPCTSDLSAFSVSKCWQLCANSLLAYLTQCEPWLPLLPYHSITAGFRSTAWPNVCASVCSHSITYFTPGQGYPTPPSIFLRGQSLAYNSQQTSGGNKVPLSSRRNVSRFIPLTSHSLNQMNFHLHQHRSYTWKQVPLINHITEILAFLIVKVERSGNDCSDWENAYIYIVWNDSPVLNGLD